MDKSRNFWSEFLRGFFESRNLFVPFGNSEKKLESEDIEHFEVKRGDYKTNITVYFNHLGYPVTLESSTIFEGDIKADSLEDLKNRLDIAVETEDYQLAADLQKEIKELEKPTQDK